MNRSRLSNKPVRFVLGSDRYFATGCRCASNGGSVAIVSFNADPRAVNASPAPVRLSCTATRVLESNVLNTSSNCTGTRV